ncbi:MAG: hypothetical protein VW362_13180 [Candidatus Nanopelagicales bacterium]
MQTVQQDGRDDRCEPAYGLIRKLGGCEQVAMFIRRHGIRQARAMNRVAVYRWTVSQGRGGTGGQIPAKHWAALIKAGREELGIVVSIDDLSPAVAEQLQASTTV